MNECLILVQVSGPFYYMCSGQTLTKGSLAIMHMKLTRRHIGEPYTPKKDTKATEMSKSH